MLTILDFAKLALHVYKSPDTKRYLGNYVKGDALLSPKRFLEVHGNHGIYEILLDHKIQTPHAQPHSSSNFGFYASFYVKVENDRLTAAVVAIRGTYNIPNIAEDIKSWWTSVMLHERARLPDYYNGLALAFSNKARDFCHEHNVPKNQFYVTGHSLGGAIAALLPAYNGIHVRAVTFNAPGIADMKKVAFAHNMIINFRSTFDFVSSIDRAVGNLFPINVSQHEEQAKNAFELSYEHQNNEWSRFDIIKDLEQIYDFLVSVMGQHSMNNVFQAIQKASFQQNQPETFFDPHATFDAYERQFILPGPFPTLYPGEASLNQLSTNFKHQVNLPKPFETVSHGN
jgi:pimeloyl-ACP methyl ester carboxylesterase